MIPLRLVEKQASEIRAGDVLVMIDPEHLVLERVLTAFRQRDWRYRVVREQARVMWHDGESYVAEDEVGDPRSWAYHAESPFLVVSPGGG